MWNATVTDSATQYQIALLWANDTRGDNQQVTLCEAVNATYVLQVDHDGLSHSVSLVNVSSHGGFGTENLPAYTGTSPANSSNTPQIRSALNYAAVTQAIASTLAGNITNEVAGGGTSAVAISPGTMVAMSNFAQLNQGAWTATNDVAGMFQSLVGNVTIGLLSMSLETFSNTVCTIVNSRDVYVYQPVTLWVPYAAVFGLSVLAVIVGLHALWMNGFKRDLGFTTLLSATRNPELDALVLSSGSQKELSGARLRYAPLSEGGSEKLVFRTVG